MIHCPKCSHTCPYKKAVEKREHRRGKDTQEDHVSLEAGLGETNVSHRSWQTPRRWKRKPILPRSLLREHHPANTEFRSDDAEFGHPTPSTVRECFSLVLQQVMVIRYSSAHD